MRLENNNHFFRLLKSFNSNLHSAKLTTQILCDLFRTLVIWVEVCKLLTGCLCVLKDRFEKLETVLKLAKLVSYLIGAVGGITKIPSR